MDFHALPRRDLQALCKRNGIRANMTNVAMADALAALPAVVDGIEEEEKEAAAKEEEKRGEGEMQGISLPGGSGVALTPHEVILLDDSQEEYKDLMPAPGVGRRRASRRARVEPVASPATRKRAAAAEAVPARTTRAWSQRTVVSAPEEEAPTAKRTPMRAVVRKTRTEQEEEEEGTQGDVLDDCVLDSSVQERQTDVQQCQDSPVFRNDTVSSEEIQHAGEDAEMVPLISSDAAAKVNTSGAAEKNEVPTSGGMLQSTAKAIEEMDPVAAPTTTRRAAASMGEIATQAVPARATRAWSQRVVVSAPEEEAPKARRASRRAVARKTSREQEEQEKGTRGDLSDDFVVDSSVEKWHGNVQQCEDSPVFQNDAVSSEEIHHASEDTEMVPVNEVPLATLKSSKAAEEVDFTSGANENGVPTSAGMLQSAAKAIEGKEPVAALTTRKGVTAHMDETGAEVVPARTTRARSQMAVVSAPEEEGPKTRRMSRRAVARKTSAKQEEEEKGTQGDVSDDRVVDSLVQERQVDVQQFEESPIFWNDTVSSEEIHHATEDTEMVPVNEVAMLKSSEAVGEVDFTSGSNENEVPTSGGMVQSALKAIEEKAADELANNTYVFIEEEAAVATDEMPQSSAIVEESAIEVVTVDNLSQATVTDDKGVVKEGGFTADLTHVCIEEDAAVVTDEMTLSLDESIKEEVVPVENLSQATLTDDEGAVKGSGFSCDLSDVSVEEDGVVAADEMSQRPAI